MVVYAWYVFMQDSCRVIQSVASSCMAGQRGYRHIQYICAIHTVHTVHIYLIRIYLCNNSIGIYMYGMYTYVCTYKIIPITLQEFPCVGGGLDGAS